MPELKSMTVSDVVYLAVFVNDLGTCMRPDYKMPDRSDQIISDHK